MRRLLNPFALTCALALACFILLPSCQDEDEGSGGAPTGRSASYALSPVSGSALSGTALFEELEGGAVRATLTLSGASEGVAYVADLREGVAGNPHVVAPVSLSLGAATAESPATRTFSRLADGTAMTYDDFLASGALLTVSEAETPDQVLAEADVGGLDRPAQGRSFEYVAYAENSFDPVGAVRFEETVGGSVVVTVELDSSFGAFAHPARLNANSAVESGATLATLNPVDGLTGAGKTAIRDLADGTAVTYDALLSADAHVRVFLASDQVGTVIAEADVGGNRLTGTSYSYPLNELNASGVTGLTTFYQRADNTTLVVSVLEGTEQGDSHPCHIHANSITESGPVIIGFNAVVGGDGTTRTQVEGFDAGGTATFDDLLLLDGYLLFHNSADDLLLTICGGDMGGNELTGEAVTYAIGEANGSGLSGQLTFNERRNGNTLVTACVSGGTDGELYPVGVYGGAVGGGGALRLKLNDVDAFLGQSATHVELLEDETPVSYGDWFSFDGHARLFPALDEREEAAAVGNLGANGGDSSGQPCTP